MIIKIRKIYDEVTDYTINEALTSCIVTRDSSNLVNTMELTYKRDGEHANSFVTGALLWGINNSAASNYKTDAYIITRIKKTDKEIRATAEEVCRYIFRGCAVFPVSNSGNLQAAMNAIYYQAVPRPDYTDRYYYLLTTTYTTGADTTNCPINIKIPTSLLDVLKGSEGSIADLTHLRINLSSKIRSDGIDINVRFSGYPSVVADYVITGREIIESSFEQDMNYYAVRAVPYWRGTVNDVETVITNGSPYIGRLHYLCDFANVVDLSGKYKEAPTLSQVYDAGADYIQKMRDQYANGNYYVKIQDGMTVRKLSQTGESSTIRSIKADIGNLISITLLTGEKIVARVTQTEYDMLREVYTKIDLGEKIDSFSRMLAKDIRR